MALKTAHAVIGALALLGVGGLALYGTGSNLGNLARLGSAAPCAPSGATVRAVAPHARGEIAAFDISQAPRPAPALAFKTADGRETDLAALKGKTLLVNLWATWCAPCKAEMPALDRLQADLGGDAFQVVAINLDTRNLDKPPAWLRDNGITRLGYYADPAGRVLPAMQTHAGTVGLPTTVLIDAAGCEIGVVKGPADWAGEDAKRLIRTSLGAGS